jgi:hypothetical protein
MRVAGEGGLVAMIATPAMRHGNVSMSRTGDILCHVLEATYQQYLRPRIPQAFNDSISNAIAELPIFPHYSFDPATLYGAFDGQEFGVARPAAGGAAFAQVLWPRPRSVVTYPLLCKYLPLQASLIGAQEFEAHHVLDIWYRNTSDLVPEVITGDINSVNKINFATLLWSMHTASQCPCLRLRCCLISPSSTARRPTLDILRSASGSTAWPKRCDLRNS